MIDWPGERNEITTYFCDDRRLYAFGSSVDLLFGTCFIIPGGRTFLACKVLKSQTKKQSDAHLMSCY
jgi:hypothetical protein